MLSKFEIWKFSCISSYIFLMDSSDPSTHLMDYPDDY